MKGTKAFEPVRARHKALRGCMAFVLAFGLCGVAPTVALASEESTIAEWQAAVDQMDSPSYQPYSYADTSDEAAPAANALEDDVYVGAYGRTDAESFDLRDHGLVTPVKLQNPWGTCWGFAAIAAAESSLLAEMGTTYAKTPIDLSERHLAYFAYTATPESEDWWGVSEGKAGYQGGEGAHNKSNDLNFMFNMGGLMVYATTMFASGCGPVVEDEAPYRNNEGTSSAWFPTMTLNMLTKEPAVEPAMGLMANPAKEPAREMMAKPAKRRSPTS